MFEAQRGLVCSESHSHHVAELRRELKPSWHQSPSVWPHNQITFMVIDKREVGAPLFKITPFYHQILKFKVQSGESVYLAEFWPVPNVCQNHTRSKNLRGQKGLRVREPVCSCRNGDGEERVVAARRLAHPGEGSERAGRGTGTGAGARHHADAVLMTPLVCRALCWAPWRNTKGLGDPTLP